MGSVPVGEQIHWCCPLIAEWKNIRNALDWCLAQDQYEDALQFWTCLKGFTMMGGRWLQRQNWLESLLQMAKSRNDLSTMVDIQFHQSFTYAFIDEMDSQGQALKLALEAWDQHHVLDPAIQFTLAIYIAALYIRKQSEPNNSETHRASAKTWLNCGRAIIEANSVATSSYQYPSFQLYYYQAEMEFRAGEQDQAYQSYIQAHQLAKKAGCQRYLNYANGSIGLILAQKGALMEAEKHLKKLLQGTEKYQDLRAGSICLLMLANVKKEQGNLNAAQAYAEQAKLKFKRLNMKREMDQTVQFLNNIK